MTGSLDPTARTFLGSGYVKLLDRKTYGLFRALILEKNGVREVIKELGPISLLREIEDGEDPRRVVLRTAASDGRPLQLVEVR